MPNLKSSQTLINIMTAFAGESQARNRYTFAASKAKNAGYIKVSQIFEETADQEKEHAKRLFKFVEGLDEEVAVSAAFPAFGVPGDVTVHLKNAAAGEHHEWTEMYPGFAKTAKAEGFTEIAGVMEHISVAERYHESRFNEYLDEIKNGTYFKSDGPVVWRCLNCGYVHNGQEPPTQCPVCAHPIDYFENLFNVVKP